jgi:predicted nucleotidyltransferase
MNSTFVRPLRLKDDKVDTAVLGVVRRIFAAAHDSKTRFFLAGATAREILLRHVFGRSPGRQTLDVDFGIAVESWQQFETLKSALVRHAQFNPHPKQKQRLIDTTNGVVVDLIPFGGVERDSSIFWPPDEDIVMRVTGFSDALRSAVPVEVAPDLVVPVVSLPLLLVLKLFAWSDRRAERRDASDIYTLMHEYGDAGNDDRLYGEHLDILEQEGFDFVPAGARLLGIDVAVAISEGTREQITQLLRSESDMSQLIDQMIVLSGGLEDNTADLCELLIQKLRQGYLEFLGTAVRDSTHE